MNNRQGEWWLIGQILLVLAHLLPTLPPIINSGIVWPIWLLIFGNCLFFVGIIKATRAFISLGPNLSPLPKPKPGAILVKGGSYRSCRHPLYQGLLTSSIGVMIALGSLFHLFLFIALTALLITKAKKEEQELKSKHSDYINYLVTTPAIVEGIPFLDWRS